MATAQFAQMGSLPHALKPDLDMESFFDFNQGTSLNSPQLSGPTPRPSIDASAYYSAPSPFEADDAHMFTGPSHEYDRFKQQTGLPVGSVASFSAMNPPVSDTFTPSHAFGGFNSGIDDMAFDHGFNGSWSSGIDVDADMGMDFNASQTIPAIYYPQPGPSQSRSAEFVDPTSIGTNDASPSNVGRVWPGMHQQQAQQAAMAKAQVQAQVQQQRMQFEAQQQQQRRLAQQQQQQQAQHQQQQQAEAKPNRSRASSYQSDPHTEESISRLLNQMRQGSAGPSGKDDSANGMLPHVARMRKEEEDMDEDERLLNSEEGKKLSSKERRQLRNKVSARAFRSRRKEYISQLEGEVAMKAQEANDLRVENRSLQEENGRCRRLIEVLLRHPAYAPFIEDISKDPSLGGSVGQAQQGAAGSVPSQREAPLDMSLLNLNNGLQVPSNFQKSTTVVARSQQRLLATCTRLQNSRPHSTATQDQRASPLIRYVSDDHKNTPALRRQQPRSEGLQAFRPLPQYSAHSRLNRAPKLRGERQAHLIEFPPSASVKIPKGPGLEADTRYRRMRSFIQFITTPTADTTGTSLLLHFDSKRYLIGNIAEGTQRASVEQKVRLLKVSELFLTGNTTWDRTGGLIGMILTLADSSSSSTQASLLDAKRKILTKLERNGTDINDETVVEQAAEQAAREIKDKARLSIFGGPNLNYTLATARRFVFRKGMSVDVHEYGNDIVQALSAEPTWSDDNVRVWALPISPASESLSASSSPRKRSYDELNGQDSLKTSETLSHADKEKALMISKAVISDMFDSSWRLDALVETPIHEVQLPATLFVHDPETHKLVKYTGPMPGGKEPVPNIKVMVRRPWPGALIETLPPTEPAKVAMSYIFRNHVVRGRFQPQKAIDLGVGKGPKWAALGKGQNVENDKGETVTPDMVLEPSKQGGGAAVIDLPSREYVEALVSRPEWKSEDIMAGVGAFIWILGPDVASHPMLKQFMEDMKHMKHIVSSPELCPNRLALDSAASATTRLGQIDPTRFNTPVHDNTSPAQTTESATGLEGLVTIADRGQKLQLEPSLEIQDDEVNTLLDVEKVKAEMSQDVLDRARMANENVKASRQALEAWADSLPQKDVEITTLGTGSALPSKYRNVSATLVRVPGWGSMLLDAGENTLGQLKRVYTADVFNDIMKELRVIWISHMHADHHLGTVSVIREWYKTVHGSQPAPIINPGIDVDFDATAVFSKQDRLSVISEPAMLHWLEEYSHADDYGFSRLAPLCITPNVFHKNVKSTLQWFIPPSSTQALSNRSAAAMESWANRIACAQVSPQALNLKDIQCVQVQHCHGARAVSVTFPSGFKASYSGDCRPSRPFMHIGKGSTVCIHEATFDDELQGDAEAKNHTTTSEALGVALGMGAKACVLTHFSQRYQKVPVLEYTNEDEGTVNSLAATGDEMDISTNTDDEVDAPTAVTAAPPSEPKALVDSTSANKVAKHIKIKAGSDMKVCVAFDYMRIKVGDIAQLEKYTDALVALFAEEEQAEGVKPQAPKKAKGKGGKSQRNN
ncbi:hypothetical protein E4T50_08968 [Aureobasidium sp. EXF-12298]|nr:hypothetical protein E4T50_08968 [Aureobasidium sp. EXF-12298]